MLGHCRARADFRNGSTSGKVQTERMFSGLCLKGQPRVLLVISVFCSMGLRAPYNLQKEYGNCSSVLQLLQLEAGLQIVMKAPLFHWLKE